MKAIYIYICICTHACICRAQASLRKPARAGGRANYNFVLLGLILKKTIKIQLSHIISKMNDENSAV